MGGLTSKDALEEVGVGTMVISVDPTKRSPSVILKENGVTIVSTDPAIGIHVDDTGVTLQGNIMFSSSGKNISKGIYTENDNSAKPYTYTETVEMEATAKEQIYTQMGKQGIDIGMLTQQGMTPLMTNIAAGPLPHLHTMMFKHVHKVEPAYLYKLSPLLTGLKGTVNSFQSFISL